MGFQLPDHWVWDAWYIEHSGTVHMYFLQAPKSVGNPDHRHFYAQVGHATSTDYQNWDYHGIALGPSDGPAWDDLAIWTGCVIENPNGGWNLYYTGTSRGERGHIQRIGMATSDDLFNWTKVDEPVVEADPEHYAQHDASKNIDQACRDPFVFADPQGGGWHMYFTAARNAEQRKEMGVIAHATSSDLVNWRVQEPIWSTPMAYELEVPEVFEIDNIWYLSFSMWSWGISDRYRLKTGASASGTYYLRSKDGPLGPWENIDEDGLLTDPSEEIYVARKVDLPSGEDALIAFNNLDHSGEFVGTLTDPIPFHATADGSLVLTEKLERKEA